MEPTRGGIEDDHGLEGCRRGASVLSRVPEGVLRYCERCNRYAVEFGTVCLRLTPTQLSRLTSLAGCLLSRCRDEPSGCRFSLALGRSSAALMVDADQLASLLALLDSGAERVVRFPLDAPARDISEVIN